MIHGKVNFIMKGLILCFFCFALSGIFLLYIHIYSIYDYHVHEYEEFGMMIYDDVHEHLYKLSAQFVSHLSFCLCKLVIISTSLVEKKYNS